jgi:NAD(P)H-hydrate epimerase
LIDDFEGPAVLDADALNLIAAEGALASLEGHHLITPHPGEMARLLPLPPGALTRAETARELTRRTKATLLFKGARTIVTAPDESLRYNTTGTPGMATGGQGDVLTGLLAALLSRGLSPIEAAATGAWLSGRASEIALGRESIESLSATITAKHLGPAFRDLRAARC